MLSKRVLIVAALALMLAMASALPVEHEAEADAQRRELATIKIRDCGALCNVAGWSGMAAWYARAWTYGYVLCPFLNLCPAKFQGW